MATEDVCHYYLRNEQSDVRWTYDCAPATSMQILERCPLAVIADSSLCEETVAHWLKELARAIRSKGLRFVNTQGHELKAMQRLEVNRDLLAESQKHGYFTGARERQVLDILARANARLAALTPLVGEEICHYFIVNRRSKDRWTCVCELQRSLKLLERCPLAGIAKRTLDRYIVASYLEKLASIVEIDGLRFVNDYRASRCEKCDRPIDDFEAQQYYFCYRCRKNANDECRVRDLSRKGTDEIGRPARSIEVLGGIPAGFSCVRDDV